MNFNRIALIISLLGGLAVSTFAGEDDATMTTCNGVETSLFAQPLDDSRDYVYCELVFNYAECGGDIYSTSPLAPCNTTW